jgi:uncharacterized protein (TIGR02118 family)
MESDCIADRGSTLSRREADGEELERLIREFRSAAMRISTSPSPLATTTGRKDQKMAKVLVMYKTPKSAEAFDKHYAAVHIPLAKKIPGLKKYDISHGGVGTPAGPSDIHLVATLHFESLDALKAGMGSPEGRAAGGDLANFADGGADLYLFDTKEV